MTYDFVAYERAQACTDGPAPGALALLAWLNANAEGRSLGVFNCRTVRGASTTSLHGEGRAVDWAVAVGPDGKGTRVGHDLVEKLGNNAEALGIQCIIYDRTIWSQRSPGGREYTGVHPHYDHLHIEMNRDAARSLTLAAVVDILGGNTTPPAEGGGSTTTKKATATKATAPTSDWFEEMIVSLGMQRKGSRGAHVRRLQHMLGLFRVYLTVDGIFGPKTERAVVEFQQTQRIGVDGIVGPQTWRQLLERGRL